MDIPSLPTLKVDAQEVYVVTEQLDFKRSPISKRLGKPSPKQYISANDILSLILTMFCFALAVSSVQNIRFAAYLRQTNQLVLLGLTLAVMSFTTSKQAQLLLINLEARFGGSFLQNYDAILRNNKFDRHTTLSVRLALIALYTLPLGLSAAYKQYVNGSTTIPSTIPGVWLLQYGPSAPPGMFIGSGIAGIVNATSPLYGGSPVVLAKPPEIPSELWFRHAYDKRNAYNHARYSPLIKLYPRPSLSSGG